MVNTYTDTPIASHTLAADQPVIEGNFLYLANTLGTSNGKNGDHQIALTGVDTTQFEGRHRQVCLNNRNGAAPTVAGIGDGTNAMIYADTGNLFFGSATGAGAFQLTTYNGGANFGGYATIATAGYKTMRGAGWTFLPGGLIYQYGFIQTPSNSEKMKFPIPFPTNVMGIFLTLARNASGGDSVWINTAGTNNLSEFAIRASTSGAAYIYITAIGN